MTNQTIAKKAFNSTVGIVSADTNFRRDLGALVALKKGDQQIKDYQDMMVKYANKVGGSSANEIKKIRARFGTIEGNKKKANWTLYFTSDSKTKQVVDCQLARVKASAQRVDGGVRNKATPEDEAREYAKDIAEANTDCISLVRFAVSSYGYDSVVLALSALAKEQTNDE